MTNTFKNYMVHNIGTTVTSVYTCPVGTTATVIGMTAANTISSVINMDIQLQSATHNITCYMVKGMVLNPNSSSVPVGGEQKLVMTAGDILKLTSSTTNSLDVILSVLEMS